MSITLRRNRKHRGRLSTSGHELAAAVAPRAEKARDAAVLYGESARDWAVPRVERAGQVTKELAGPHLETARDWAAPRVEGAVEKARTDVLPKVAAATAATVAAAAPMTGEARTRGSAALLALRGDLQPPASRRRGRRLLELTALGALLSAAWYAWNRRSRTDPWAQPEETWSSTYSSPSPSAPVGTAASAAADPTASEVTAEEALRAKDESGADGQGYRQMP